MDWNSTYDSSVDRTAGGVCSKTGAHYDPNYACGPASYYYATKCEDLGRKGRKSGGGFYEYPEGGKKHLWKGLSEYFPLAEEQPSLDEAKERLLYAQIIPAAQCYAEGIVTTFSCVNGSGSAWSSGVAEEEGVAVSVADEEIEIAVIIDIGKERAGV